jgi:hypothetical protein
LVACGLRTVPVCTVPVVEGATCDPPLEPEGSLSNRECFVADAGERLDAPRIAGRTCACDRPGPVWRCAAGVYEWTPPPTSCNALTQRGDVVSLEIVADDPPNLEGGTFADGEYVLKRAVEFVGIGGIPGGARVTLRETLRIASGRIEIVETHDGPQDVRLAGSLSPSSSNAVWAMDTCPANAYLFWTYAATSTGLRLMDHSGGVRGPRLLVFERR